MTTRLDLALLGPLEVRCDGEPVAIGGLRRRGVLAMLALEAGRVVSVGRLIEGVWGEEPPETAATALHGHVSQLRRLLGDVIATRTPGYVLEVDRSAVDVHRFEQLLERAREERAAGRCEEATLDEALALWRGPPLADLQDAPFAAAALPALTELGLTAREERIEAQIAAGRHEQVIPGLKALVAEHPLRERPRRQLLVALHRAGRRAEALDAYDTARRTFSAELGIEPGEALRALHLAILSDDAPAERAAPAALPSPPARHRRRGRWAVVPVAAAVVAAIAFAARDEDAPPAVLEGSGVLRIDPGSMAVAATARIDGTPSSITAARGRAWVINADEQTVSELTAAGRRGRTFASGASPTDLAASGTELWVAEGTPGASQFLGPVTRTVSHVDTASRTVRGRVDLPAPARRIALGQGDRLALSRRAVWVIAADGRVVEIDQRSEEVVKVSTLQATALAAGGDGAWALTRDGTAQPLAERAGTARAPIDVGPGATELAVGGGALWIRNPSEGTVTRIDVSRPSDRRTVQVGAGAGALAFGHDALWVTDAAHRRLLRLDATSGEVSGEAGTRGVPRDVAVSPDGVWVSVLGSGDGRASACGPTLAGGGAPDAVLVADLPLGRGRRSPTESMASAVARTIERRRFRAGRFRVGYRVCNDSTAQAGGSDPAKCEALARAYARDERIVAEIGPYDSGCARRQIPIAADAPGGPLAMLAPTATAPDLTRDVPSAAGTTFTRIVASDDRQAGAMADEMARRGVRSVFVLDDDDGSSTYGLEIAGYFAAAARRTGIRIAGRASWGRADAFSPIAMRVARSGADAVYVSGLLDNDAGGMVRAVRRKLGRRAVIAGPDLLLPVATLFERAAGHARGMLLSTTVVPERSRGRDSAAAVYAAVATDVALDAIARSDGTRASVARAVRATDDRRTPIGRIAFTKRGDLRRPPIALLRVLRGGGSDELLSTDGAELIRVARRR